MIGGAPDLIRSLRGLSFAVTGLFAAPVPADWGHREAVILEDPNRGGTLARRRHGGRRGHGNGPRRDAPGRCADVRLQAEGSLSQINQWAAPGPTRVGMFRLENRDVEAITTTRPIEFLPA